MNRIEEIKERTKNEEYIKRDIDYYDAQDDVQYLLSRLEIAETELRKIIYSKLGDPNITADKIILMADDALQKLRE